MLVNLKSIVIHVYHPNVSTHLNDRYLQSKSFIGIISETISTYSDKKNKFSVSNKTVIDCER